MVSRDERSLPRCERCNRPQRGPDGSRAQQARRRSALWSGFRRALWSVRPCACRNSLPTRTAQHVARWATRIGKDDEQRVASFVTGYVQGEQRRHVRQAQTQIISPHCTLAVRSRKRVVSAPSEAEIGSSRKPPDGDQDREQPVPVDGNQEVLQREEKRRKLTTARDGRRVACVGDRHVLAQALKGDEAEQRDGAGLADPERRRAGRSSTTRP